MGGGHVKPISQIKELLSQDLPRYFTLRHHERSRLWVFTSKTMPGGQLVVSAIVATPHGAKTEARKVTDSSPSIPHHTKKELEPEERGEKGTSRPGPLFHLKFPCRVKT